MVRDHPMGRQTETEGGSVFNSEPVMAVAVPCGCRICIADNFFKYQQHIYSSFLRDNCTLDKPSFKEEERHSSLERLSYLPKITQSMTIKAGSTTQLQEMRVSVLLLHLMLNTWAI